MNYPNLSKAPIVEGLIDIQVRQRPEFTFEKLTTFVDRYKGTYPSVKEAQHFQAAIKLESGKSPSQEVQSTKAGFRLERQSPPFVVLARVNGITISRLAPYDTWEDLSQEAGELWKAYCEISKPETVTRVATRFVNRIELPIAGLDFDDYLAAAPKVPKGLPQILTHFMSRLVIPDEDSGSDIAIAQAFESVNPLAQKVAIILDIDVFKEVDLPFDSPEIWNTLNTMRNLKNQAFFDSLTPQALELFK